MARGARRLAILSRTLARSIKSPAATPRTAREPFSSPSANNLRLGKFRPLHVDRCEALARDVPEIPVIGLEILSRSSDYDWISESSNSFKKITLSSPEERDPWSPWKIISAIASNRPQAVFFCHYQRPEILLAAFMVRALGIKTFTMNDSKFDDYRRDLWREAVKTFFLLPYQGALAASQRSADYLRFLGIQRHHIALGYDAVSVSRIRHLANSAPAPGGEDFANRHFTIVAIDPQKEYRARSASVGHPSSRQQAATASDLRLGAPRKRTESA